MQEMDSVRRLLVVIGSTLSWAFTTLLFAIFFAAAVHPSNKVLLDVNVYHEGIAESVVFFVAWIAITAHTFIVLKGKF